MTVYADYYTYIPRHVQQEGQSAPEYVTASKQSPAIIRIPSEIMRGGVMVPQPEDRFLKKIKDGAKPDVTKPAHPLLATTEPPNLSAHVDEDGNKRTRKRAADQ